MEVINGKSVDDAMADCAEAFGQIDLLGSNAEDLSVKGVPDIDAYECCRVIGYHGVFLCWQATARIVDAQKTEGWIICISSIACKEG